MVETYDNLTNATGNGVNGGEGHGEVNEPVFEVCVRPGVTCALARTGRACIEPTRVGLNHPYRRAILPRERRGDICSHPEIEKCDWPCP